MSDKERNNRRGREETPQDIENNAYTAEQETASVGKVAEKPVTAVINTGLKIGETKEKLVVSKDSTKLQTDRRSVNFHSEKRNSRFQVDRLSALDENGVDDEDTDNNEDEENTDTSDNDGVSIDDTDNKKIKSSEPTEPDGDDEAKAKRKKVIQRKQRERMREQRQRASHDERHNPAASANYPFFNDDFADLDDYENFDDYNDYSDNGGNDDYTDIKQSEPTIENEDIDLKRSKNSDTSKEKPNETGARNANRNNNGNNRTRVRIHKEDRTHPLITENADKPGKLKITKKTQPLKQEKNEVKLKTEKQDNADFALNNHEDKLDRKKRKLRKRQRNSLVTQKYNLKKARLAHASATGKLIINSADTKTAPSLVHAVQGDTNTGQGQSYAEQEQDNLNRNVVNVASSGLKSLRTDFETFEATLFPADNAKELQREFTKKKQYKIQRAKNKAGKTLELERQAVIKDNVNQNNQNANDIRSVHTDVKSNKGENDYSLTDRSNDTSYSLNSREDNNNALNQRNEVDVHGDSNEISLINRDNDTNLIKTNDNSDNLLNLSKRKAVETESVPEPVKRKGSNRNKTNEAQNTATDNNSFNLVQRKKDTPTDTSKSHIKSAAVDSQNENRTRSKNGNTNNENETVNKNGKKATTKETPPTTKDTKVSRLKHDNTPHNRKSGTTTETSTKLKFNKENPSYHESKGEKLRLNRDKGKNRSGNNAPSASEKDKNRRKAAQKLSNKKKIQKTARKNQKKLSEKSAQVGSKVAKTAVGKAIEAVKYIAMLVLKKIIALILFLIGKIALIGTLILIPVIVIAVIGVIFLGTAGTILLSSYLADDETLTEVSVYYSGKESDLINSIAENTVKSTYNVDEVNYVFVDNIGHNPHVLLSYLTAKYQDFTFNQVKSELDTIFNLQYTKTITVRTENIPILDGDGNPTGDYDTRRIADVTLTNNGFYDILYARLTADQREHFLLLLETMGNRQYGGFPMSWDWLINITEDFNNVNNGVEAETPINTPVYGTINGEIVSTTADSVSIQGTTGEDTIIITFSRLNSVTVNVGDTAGMTTVVGYTSDRIFIQIQRNGVYVNPVLFLGSQRQDLVYGTTIPPLTLSEFNALRDFASTAIGTPYVFGGTGPPPHGIDCSGFVWWAINGSGTKSWGRTTAQGQFNQCDPITLADARPGDLIFFQGTYDTKDSRIVTHVGIYMGNGLMQHSGSPNEITSIHSAYWQRHFYSFGRLRR